MWCSSFFAMQWLWSSNDYFVGKYKSNYKFCCLFMFLHLSCLGLCVKYINLGEVSLYYNYIVYNNHAQQYHCQYLKGVPPKSVITVLHLILWVFFIFSKYENFSLQLNNIYLKYPIIFFSESSHLWATMSHVYFTKYKSFSPQWIEIFFTLALPSADQWPFSINHSFFWDILYFTLALKYQRKFWFISESLAEPPM